MAEPTKIVKGGFRANLALIISVIALLLSILAYTSSKSEQGLQARIKDLQVTIDRMKTESTEQLDKLRNETAKTLEKMSNTIKPEEQNK
jgi:gas vesicle protein